VVRGVVGFDNGSGLLSDATRVVAAAVDTASRQEVEDISLLKERVRLELKRYLQKEIGARPLITPVVVSV